MRKAAAPLLLLLLLLLLGPARAMVASKGPPRRHIFRSSSSALNTPATTTTTTQRRRAEDDSADANYYWKEAAIHNFGNTGWGGRLHSLVAPLATKIINTTSYKGRDVRKEVHSLIAEQVGGQAQVLDLCCGVGFSTAPGALGVDASSEMISMARLCHPGKTFVRGNAETFGEPLSYDIVTLMFVTHEMPQQARMKVLRNAARIARKFVLVVDIDPAYKLLFLNNPVKKAQAKAFLAGEPYVLDYLQKIHTDVEACSRQLGSSWKVTNEELLEGHVTTWKLERK